MRPSLSHTVVAVALAGLALTAVSAGSPPAAGDVNVTNAAITASSQHQDVNPKLRDLAREVRKNVETSSLTGFRLGQTDSRSLNVGQKESFKLVDDAAADITVLRRYDDRQRVQLEVKVPLIGEITYETCYDKFFPIVTRYLTKNERDRLIVAVMVKSVAREKDKK